MAATKMNSPALPQNQRTDVHPGAFRVFAGIFAAMMTALFLVFWSDKAAVAMVFISTAYGLMYLGIPLVGAHLAEYNRPWSDFLQAEIQTFTGTVTGRSFLIQLCAPY